MEPGAKQSESHLSALKYFVEYADKASRDKIEKKDRESHLDETFYSYRNFLRQNLLGKEIIFSDDVEDREFPQLVKAAEEKNLDNYFINTVVSGHGSLDVGTFIVVPKNTIVMTFVTDGLFLVDYERDFKGKRNQSGNFIFMWIRYLLIVLEIIEREKRDAKKNKSVYDSAKYLINIMLDMKEKYLEKHRKKKRVLLRISVTLLFCTMKMTLFPTNL
jgi:hypothetical protein